MSLKMGHLTRALRKVENELCRYMGALGSSRQSERKGPMPSCTGARSENSTEISAAGSQGTALAEILFRNYTALDILAFTGIMSSFE